jgi:hypothetical protein
MKAEICRISNANCWMIRGVLGGVFMPKLGFKMIAFTKLVELFILKKGECWATIRI